MTSGINEANARPDYSVDPVFGTCNACRNVGCSFGCMKEQRDAAYAEGWNEATKHTSETWRALLKSVSETARLWAVSMGGNTPVALLSNMLSELVASQPKVVSAREVYPKTKVDEGAGDSDCG